MAIMRFDRGSDFDVLRREMDRLFESFFPAHREGGEPSVWTPRADLSETDDAYVLSLDLPGIRREDLEIMMENGTLRISGERNMQEEHEGRQYYRIERAYGRFFRSFDFGPNADPDNVEASFDDGVLTVRVGKLEDRKPRRIEVGSRQAIGAGA